MKARSTKSSTPKSGQVAVAACVFEVTTDGDAVQLLPHGEFRAHDGRPADAPAWKLNREIAERAIARARARGIDIVIDYEHQTLNAETNGQAAPAAGWVKPADLEYRDGKGLYGRNPQWTVKAKGHIDAKEYRYLSAVFPYSRATGEVLDIFHIGLTNFPAIGGMDELTARAAAKFSTDSPEDIAMDKLLKLFGLKKDAGEDEIVAAAKALQDENAALKSQVQEKDAAIAAAKAKPGDGGDPDPAKFVSVDVVEQLKSEIAALKGQVTDNQVDDLVTTALEDGRLLPAQEDWARKLGKSDIAALKGYLENAQPIAALRGTQTGGKGPAGDGDGELDEEQLAVCRAMGVSPEDFKKTLKAESVQ